jgi:hypothetical protein
MAGPLPPGDIKQFAMMGVNPPTAYLLLTDIVKLSRGSWVVQNGANSGVGRATVAIATAPKSSVFFGICHGGRATLEDAPLCSRFSVAEAADQTIQLLIPQFSASRLHQQSRAD